MHCASCGQPDQLYQLVRRTEARPVLVRSVAGRTRVLPSDERDGWTMGAVADGFWCGHCQDVTEPSDDVVAGAVG